MIKRIFLLFNLCIFLVVIVKSQPYKFIYYLDENLVTVEKQKAVLIGKGYKENNLLKLDCFSVYTNALAISLHFKDSTLTVVEGVFRSYHVNGKPEQEGNYVNGFEEGTWYKWDTLGRKVDSVFYKNGLPYIHATYTYNNKNGSLSYYSLTDSLPDIYQTISFNEDGSVGSEVFFKGQKGLLKRYSETGVQTDSLFTREESEAVFPGGDEGWRDYLERHLNPNVPVNNGARAGKYKVIVKFIVTKDGTVKDVFAETYHGYGMEKEVIRIINKGPKWIPAVQYGRKVNAYRRQPVVFLVE